MDERDWLAERFQEHRPRLRAEAYRMLGSTSRGRRRIRGADTTSDADPAAQQEVVQAFLAAARDGEAYAIGALTLQNGRITTMDILLDPARLARLDLTAFDSPL